MASMQRLNVQEQNRQVRQFDAVFTQRASQILELATLLYALTPVMLWLYYYMKPHYLLLLSVPLALASASVYREACKRSAANCAVDEEHGNAAYIGYGSLAVLLLAAAGAVFFAGIGGYTYQWFEYFAWDAILLDAITFPWPAITQIDPDTSEPVVFRYYISHFLPAAIVGKVLGWATAYHFTFVWSALGLALALAWFQRIIGSRNPVYSLLLLGYGGLDLLGYAAVCLLDGVTTTGTEFMVGVLPWHDDLPALVGMGYFDWWPLHLSSSIDFSREALGGVPFFFPSILTVMLTSPHQIVPALVILLVIFHDGIRDDCSFRAPFMWALLPFYSFVMAAGAVPFVAYIVLRRNLQRSATFPNVAGGIPLVLVGLVFAFSLSQGDASEAGFLWQETQLIRVMPYLIGTYLVEFGFYAAVYCRIWRTGYGRFATWFMLSIVVLMILPWIKLGEYNDLTIKGSIPAQLSMIVCLVTALRDIYLIQSFRRLWILLVVLLGVGALGAVGVVLRSVEFGLQLAAPTDTTVRHTDEMLGHKDIQMRPNDNFASVAWGALMKPGTPHELRPLRTIAEWDFTSEGRMSEWEFFGDEVERDSSGVLLERRSDGVFMRLRGFTVVSERVGSIVVEHEVETEQGWQPNYGMYVHWSDSEERDEIGKESVFPDWRFIGLHPFNEFFAANSYWTDEATEFSFRIAIRDNSDPVDGLRIRIRRVAMLER